MSLLIVDGGFTSGRNMDDVYELSKMLTDLSGETQLLLDALVRLFASASIAVQRYSITDDERHLLMPSRHSIANKNTDGDK